MNKQKLVELFKDPSGMDSKLVEEVEEMVHENPYFQSAYALIAAGKKKTKAQNAGKDLIKAAIYATNRVNLKKYLESAGGQQATTPKDASLKPTEKPVVKAEVKEPPKVVEKPQEKAKPAFKERFVEEDPKRKKIRSRVEVEKEQASQKKVDQVDEVIEKAAPIDLDIEELLNSLKSEYKQLETNIKSFVEAEKFLTEAEIKEEEEKKSSSTAASPKTKTPAKPAAKKTTTRAKAATKATSKTTTTTKKATTTKASTAKKATTTAKKSTTATAKKSASATAKKATTTAKKTAPKSTTKASPKTATKSTTAKSTTKSKTSTRKINIDAISDDDLLAGDEPGSSKKKEQKELIDNFIKAEPKISAKKESAKEIVNQEDLSKKNQVLGDDIVTENLANIMVKQGRIEKAVEIYNKLIWKFPHKKAYFAGRIKELKEQ